MTDFEKLTATVAKMRELGVVRLREGDFEVELGPEPQRNGVRASDLLVDNERAVEEARQEREDHRLRTLFAATSLRPRPKR